MFVTSSGSNVFRINIFDLSNPSSPGVIGTVDFSSTFGAPSAMLALSSVGVDPLGRFGVASLIPANNTGTAGQVGFFNLATGAVIGTANVGFHPDSLTFSTDGSRLVVVNEGEFNPASSTNAPGSISVFDLSGINSGNLASLPSLSATTRDFSSGNLAAGVSLSGLRNPGIAPVGTSGTFINTVPDFTQAANIQFEGMEPEFATIVGNNVYVSLQENNAIAQYNLLSNQWTAVDQLQKIIQLVDASDQDGGVSVNDSVKGIPMPDTVASYTVGGTTYIVTANEGDARGDDRDISRFGDTSGNDDMDPILDTNYPTDASGIRANTELGRLNVSRIDGDTDADGKIDEINMLGTRSFSIWAKTDSGLTLAYDSGAFFEQYIRDNDLVGFMDGRSDDKGPEPEGLTLGVIDGRTFLFVGMERTNGIFMFDVTDPNAPVFVDYIRVEDGSNTPMRPEGFAFVSAADSPTGENLLIVGFEGDGTNVGAERVAIFSVIPEPQTYALIGVGMVLLCRKLRRRRQAPVA